MGQSVTGERLIRRKRGLVPIDLPELWRYRDLFLFLTWRDILVRYKQTLIGFSWAVIQPVLMMVVFTVIFGGFAKFPSQDMPYAVMTFAAILPWQFFSTALSHGSNSLVGATNLIQKIYFPRLLLPASACLGAVVEFAIAFMVLLGLMIWYRVPFRMSLLLILPFLLLAMACSLALSLWLGALNVRYRDVKHAVPFIMRMGMYISPVGFMSSIVPEKWRLLYSLNPMVGVIDGFRWAILGPSFEPYWAGFWLSVLIVALLLVTGAYYFRFGERTFADVI